MAETYETKTTELWFASPSSSCGTAYGHWTLGLMSSKKAKEMGYLFGAIAYRTSRRVWDENSEYVEGETYSVGQISENPNPHCLACHMSTDIPKSKTQCTKHRWQCPECMNDELFRRVSTWTGEGGALDPKTEQWYDEPDTTEERND